MSDPITRREFHERLTSFGTELRTELRGEMAQLRTELRGEMAELRTELRADMENLRITLQADAQATLKALNEANRAWFRTIDDKYKDLPEPGPKTRRGGVFTASSDYSPP